MKGREVNKKRKPWDRRANKNKGEKREQRKGKEKNTSEARGRLPHRKEE